MSTQNNQSFVPFAGTANKTIPGLAQAPQAQANAGYNPLNGIQSLKADVYNKAASDSNQGFQEGRILSRTSLNKNLTYNGTNLEQMITLLELVAEANSGFVHPLCVAILNAADQGELTLTPAALANVNSAKEEFELNKLKASYHDSITKIAAMLQTLAQQADKDPKEAIPNLSLTKLALSMQQNLLNTIQEHTRGVVVALTRIQYGLPDDDVVGENRVVNTGLITDILNLCSKEFLERTPISNFNLYNASGAKHLTVEQQYKVVQVLVAQIASLANISRVSSAFESACNKIFNVYNGDVDTKYSFSEALISYKVEIKGANPSAALFGYENWSNSNNKDNANHSTVPVYSLCNLSEAGSIINAQLVGTTIIFAVDVVLNDGRTLRNVFPSISNDDWDGFINKTKDIIKSDYFFRSITLNSKQISFGSSCFAEITSVSGNTPDMYLVPENVEGLSLKICSYALSPEGLSLFLPDWYKKNLQELKQYSTEWNNKSVSAQNVQLLKHFRKRIECLVKGILSSDNDIPAAFKSSASSKEEQQKKNISSLFGNR